MSSVKTASTSDFIYSSLSFLGRRHGGELPGAWFVRAIGSLGIEEQAIRQALFRMEKDGSLVTRRAGRAKFYRPSAATSAILDAGVARVAEPVPAQWDGIWTLVHFRVGEEDRQGRDRLRDVLLTDGFAAIGPALYLHPRDRTARLMTAAAGLGLSDRLNVFRGTYTAGVDDAGLVRDLWDLRSIDARYRKFIRRFAPVSQSPLRVWTDKQIFALRFAFMFEFFRISWSDPGLPSSLLPADWPGEQAQILADRLMRKLLPGAIRYGDEILTSII
ncbi:MAG: PaaX family transcriptional regulator C-terminal domain-containing protein [Bryobacteraceae bacterium]